MATRTVVCPECDEPVPYGRLSCANCGTLLASVAGAAQRPAPLARTTTEDGRALASDDGPAGPEPDPEGPEPGAPDPASLPADEVEPVGAPADVDDASEPLPPEVELPSPESPRPDPYGADAQLPVEPGSAPVAP